MIILNIQFISLKNIITDWYPNACLYMCQFSRIEFIFEQLGRNESRVLEKCNSKSPSFHSEVFVGSL